MAKVLFAEIDGPTGDAIREIITSIPGLDLAWDVHEISAVLRLVRQKQPELVLLSHGLMQSHFVSTVRAISEQSPNTKILLLSSYNDSRFALRGIEAGASGYMLKDQALEELEDAVKVVLSNRTYLSAGIAGIERKPGPFSEGNAASSAQKAKT